MQRQQNQKPQKLNHQQAENLLEMTYKGKYCSYAYPGYDTVYGMVDNIAIDISKPEPVVVIQMNNRRYTCSSESLTECLALLKK